MIPIIIDVVMVAILVAFTVFGAKRGLILAVSGIVIMVAALYGASVVAHTYSEKFTPMIEPVVSKLVDKSVSDTVNAQPVSAQGTPELKNSVNTVGLDSLKNMGIFTVTAQSIINSLKQTVTTVGQEFKAAVTEKVSSSVSYILTFIAAYLLITIILSLALRVLDLAFNLPGLGLINGAGGLVLGFAKGLLVLFAIAWAMRYFGGIFPAETTDQTYILKWFMSNNLLAAFFGV